MTRAAQRAASNVRYPSPQPRSAIRKTIESALGSVSATWAASAARRTGPDNTSLPATRTETASTNVFLVRDGVVMTPAANGTFLNGITRQRVIALLRDDGYEVAEATLGVADFAAADEVFLTGNANKVVPVTRFEDRELGVGPVATRAKALYWDYAHQCRRAA